MTLQPAKKTDGNNATDGGRTPSPEHDCQMSLRLYVELQRDWSSQTFGNGRRTNGIIEHITKELAEISQSPADLEEWIDVIILAIDGYWRHGGRPEDLMRLLQYKQRKNFARQWPDVGPEDKATEHIRS